MRFFVLGAFTSLLVRGVESQIQQQDTCLGEACTATDRTSTDTQILLQTRMTGALNAEVEYREEHMSQSHSRAEIGTNRSDEFPSDIMTCPSGAVSATKCMTSAQYDHIVSRIGYILTNMDSTCNGAECPQADWAGCILRMAGHDFMDFQWGQGGGSDGCIDFNDGDNKGLQPCLTSVNQGVSGGSGASGQDPVFTENPSEMVAAGVPDDQRCKGKPLLLGGKRWNNLGKGTEDECKQACLDEPLCNYAVYKESTRACSAFDKCDGRASTAPTTTASTTTEPETTLLTIYQEACSTISLADFFVLAAEGVMTHTRHMAGHHDDDFKASFKYGRKTSTECSFANGRLPNPDAGCSATKTAFADVPAGEAIKHSDCSCTWAMPMMDVVASMPTGEWCGDSSLFSAPSTDGETGVSEEAATRACCQNSSTGGSQTCDDIFVPTGVAFQYVRNFAADDALWFESFRKAWNKATSMGFAHQDGVLLPLTATCSAEDSSREVPTVIFPSTTSTTTTTTPLPADVVSDEAIGRWYFAASMESCSRTCQRNGKQCKHDSWEKHGHELDSYAKMSEVIRRITSLDRSNNPGAEKAFYSSYDGAWRKNFTSMGGGTTATAAEMYTGDELTPAGIGHPWNQGYECAQDVNESDTFMTPAAHYIGTLGPGYQCRYNIPDRSYERDQCERHYHGAAWRRLCVCDTADAVPTTSVDSSACLRLGRSDPECCSRPSEASCADGFQYTMGSLCMWSHDHDYFTTECRPQQTTVTTTLPSIAEGYFLGEQGNANCNAVCEEHDLTCSAQGFKDVYDEISDYAQVSAIISAIGERDWLGLNKEMIHPKCLNDAGSGGYRIWPGTWGATMHFFNCHYYHDQNGQVDDDYCDPSNAPDPGSWRRLCKCHASTTTTTSVTLATTPTTTTGATIPFGYELAGSNAMCTDEAHTSWKEIEIGNGPRSHQASMEACAERCDDTTGCHGFVFWPEQKQCRTYRECTELSCSTCSEYSGSTAARRLVPSGYKLAGKNSMCTDEAHSSWKDVEIGNGPRSHQTSMAACAQRCDDTAGCNGFVYWEEQNQCRTYRDCTDLVCNTCSEYSGSLASRRLSPR